MVMIGVRVDGLTQAAEGVERIRVATEDGIKRQVQAETNRLYEAIVLEMSQTPTSDPFFGVKGSPGDGLSVRTGTSRSRIAVGLPVKTGDGWTASVGSPDKHIAFLESGGTITGSRYLRIPLAAAQTPQGVDRYAGTSARNIPNTFIIRTLGGKLFIAQKDSKAARTGKGQHVYKQNVTLLYLLASSVTLRGHHTFERAQQKVSAGLAAGFALTVENALREGGASG
jgi:hypothetical protein